MNLTCDDGYVLSCLVSASYGRTAGSCGELDENPNGCGIAYKRSPIKCDSDTVVCDDEDFEECTNDLTGRKVFTNSGCGDCLGVCSCGFTAPLFYNVADCFGDPTSTVCSGDKGDDDPQNIYLPQQVWKKDCVGNKQCTLEWSNTGEKYSCFNSYYSYNNVYYNAINGVEMDRFDEVVIDEMYATCAYMDLKVLAVCESV